MKKTIIFIGVLILMCFELSPAQTTKFAVIGGYGDDASGDVASVARLVKSWNPDFIVTLGGNNYPNGAASTIDKHIGRYFHEYIYNYHGTYGNGSTIQRFFPALGEQDYQTAEASPYLDYFTLPGNERYYDFVKGDVHFFVLDSNPQTPDGVSANGAQAMWLKENLAAAEETWKIVCFYHSPYSSGGEGSNHYMRWSFKEWGASAVLTGQHNGYERLRVNDLPFIVNGLGGKSGSDFTKISPSSRFRYNEHFGAMKIEAYPNLIQFQFFNRHERLIDSLTLQALAAPGSLSAKVGVRGIDLAWIDLSSAEDGFRIEKSSNNINFFPIGTVGVNQTEFTDEQATAGGRFYYRVNAFRKKDESFYSNAVVVNEKTAAQPSVKER